MSILVLLSGFLLLVGFTIFLLVSLFVLTGLLILRRFILSVLFLLIRLTVTLLIPGFAVFRIISLLILLLILVLLVFVFLLLQLIEFPLHEIPVELRVAIRRLKSQGVIVGFDRLLPGFHRFFRVLLHRSLADTEKGVTKVVVGLFLER